MAPEPLTAEDRREYRTIKTGKFLITHLVVEHEYPPARIQEDPESRAATKVMQADPSRQPTRESEF